MPTIARRIKDLSRTHKRISFIVETPNSRSGAPVQSVQLKDFSVRTAGNGEKYVVGRDLAKEIRRDRELQRTIPPGAHRRRNELQIRQYKICRIVPRSIIHG